MGVTSTLISLCGVSEEDEGEEDEGEEEEEKSGRRVGQPTDWLAGQR